jgi:NAD(P)-dependent dehydrogenase (short-subunit alcohol dehydrogenase family)
MADERVEATIRDRRVDLGGQVAFVTGATSGLGRRFAQVLSAAGASVVITGRRVERLAELAAEIDEAGGTALPLALDMTDSDAIVSTLATATEQLGAVTVLVNNAGVPDAKRAHKMPLELVDTVFDTNLRGPWVLATEFARRLIEIGRPGRIINIASMSGFHYDGHGAALYSVTKAGLIRMTEALAVEWSRNNINVNCIAPGAFESEMMDGMIERMGDFREHLPRKRLGLPEQLDQTLLYLASFENEVVTGTVIKADDGQGPR